MPTLETAYAYSGSSALAPAPRGMQLSLVAAEADTDRPRRFLTAFARYPEPTAKALRAVSEIVGSRFYVPPSMLARILREADPVATVGAGAVRFEGFSACCSAYIRLDMLDDALDVTERRSGTTNVDFGPELRAALSQVRKDNRLQITIGADAVGIAHERAAVVERKVPLPIRWLKGFAEVQVVMAEMRPAFTLSRVAAQRFLRTLPRSKSDHLQWITVAGQTVRATARESNGAVPLRGAHRLQVFSALLPFADAMRVYVNDRQGGSAWVLELPGQRLTVVLNAEPWRGFSGDGGILSHLGGGEEGGVPALRAHLNWQDRLDRDDLALSAGLDGERIDAALARLAGIGLVGFDLVEGAYFHRVLPFDLDRLDSLNPRLTAARKLVEASAVTLAPDGQSARVASENVVHEVKMAEGGMRCTCPWYARNKATRGPCKHALATEMVLENTP